MSPPRAKQESQVALSSSLDKIIEISYRSAGLGLWGVVLRAVGMPLEKIALEANSSRVSGRGQLSQACKLAFRDGWLAPYRVITARSGVAWFLQYSIMGCAFQMADKILSAAFGVPELKYGDDLFESEQSVDAGVTSVDPLLQAKLGSKLVLAPLMAGAFESLVSNKAEVQRYFGPKDFARISAQASGVVRSVAGQAFYANAGRNAVMTASSFVATPYLYMLMVPKEQKNSESLFWFGLGFNIFCGNVIGVQLQTLWGRSLDYLARDGHIDYRNVIREGLSNEGMAAFLTPAKWFSRVLMNAPVQGTVPWFYNKILPLGEPAVKASVASAFRYVVSEYSDETTREQNQGQVDMRHRPGRM